jgi:hypothetical protein
VPITEHHVVMQRAGASIARIDAALAEAQRCGTMSFFNAEYRPPARSRERERSRLYELWKGTGAATAGDRWRHRQGRHDLAVARGAGVRITLGGKSLEPYCTPEAHRPRVNPELSPAYASL